MTFFDDLDIFDILESNVTELMSLEDDEMQKLLAIYRRARGIVKKRLSLLALTQGLESFTAQQNRAILIQLDLAIQDMTLGLTSSTTSIAEKVTELGLDHLVSEVDTMSEHFTGSVKPLNIDADLVAQDTSNFLLNRFDASIENYSASLRQKIGSGLQEMLVAPTPLNQLVDTIGDFFGGEAWQVLRIARTEIHNIYAGAKLNGMVRADVGLKKTLYHPKDSRTGEDSLFLMRHAKRMVKNLDEPFEYWWNKKAGSFDGSSGGTHRVFMHPPDRPNDRSILIPYHSDWE